jgi:hypothetical protein
MLFPGVCIAPADSVSLTNLTSLIQYTRLAFLSCLACIPRQALTYFPSFLCCFLRGPVILTIVSLPQNSAAVLTIILALVPPLSLSTCFTLFLPPRLPLSLPFSLSSLPLSYSLFLSISLSFSLSFSLTLSSIPLGIYVRKIVIDVRPASWSFGAITLQPLLALIDVYRYHAETRKISQHS